MPCLKSYVFSFKIRNYCPNLTTQPLGWLSSCMLWARLKKKKKMQNNGLYAGPDLTAQSSWTPETAVLSLLYGDVATGALASFCWVLGRRSPWPSPWVHVSSRVGRHSSPSQCQGWFRSATFMVKLTFRETSRVAVYLSHAESKRIVCLIWFYVCVALLAAAFFFPLHYKPPSASFGH